MIPSRCIRWGAWVLLVPSLCLAVGEPDPSLPVVEGGITVQHTPLPSCRPYEELEVSATVQSARPESTQVLLHFRSLGQEGYYDRPMEWLGGSLYRGSVPARIVGDYGVEYYITARLGLAVASAGRPDQPLVVTTPYQFRGEVPETLPGDEFFQELSLVDSGPQEPAREETPARKTDWGTQVVIVLVLAAVGYFLYQRLSTKERGRRP